MTLRRQPRIRPAAGFAIRMAIMIGMIVFIVAFHWFERDSLRDNIDGHVSFSDVIYFTMISATTTGYGDVALDTAWGRIFSVVLMLAGISLFVSIAHKIVARPQKIGDDGTYLMELAGTGAPATVLEEARRARQRFERALAER